MARIVFKPDNIIHEIEDETSLIDACEGVDSNFSFGCTEGTCGICELTVIKGAENVSKVNETEKDYLDPQDLEKGMRLGCQLKVIKGEVVINWKQNRAK